MLLGGIFCFIIEYKGAKLGIKKCILGKGTKFIVISFKSIFKLPGKRIPAVKLLNKCATNRFIVPNGFFFYSLSSLSSLSYLFFNLFYESSPFKLTLISAALSTGRQQSEC
jgi:hypothetical protein